LQNELSLKLKKSAFKKEERSNVKKRAMPLSHDDELEAQINELNELQARTNMTMKAKGQNQGQKKSELETFNLIHLHIETLNSKTSNKLVNQGIKFGQSASEYLKTKICCKDPRIGSHNVLKLTHSALEFERIFVFYDDTKYSLDLDNQDDGAAQAKD